ncbi:hypothetical protein IQ259_13940 [Fortiea sp. LEGE XX443]|uniref:hypothetical protein n=1 Tax=Fortiea sp. LEGE XX443 TaxID=1828611 RepID=UPI001A01F1FC|nr:hypothetical protein [Fortiea sp. LEGE XX443]
MAKHPPSSPRCDLISRLTLVELFMMEDSQFYLCVLCATPVCSSRETLSAVAHGRNPQDRATSPHNWLLCGLIIFLKLSLKRFSKIAIANRFIYLLLLSSDLYLKFISI